MSEMVERVARAMAIQDHGRDQWDCISDGHSEYGEDGLFKADYMDLARAAIVAMREPTEEMYKAAHAQRDTIAPFYHGYQAAIDIALRDEA